MSRTGWKHRERQAAKLIGGTRYPANLGGLIDCESDGVCAQVKARRILSLAQIEALALEIERVAAQKTKQGILLLKRPGGYGVRTPWLVVMTAGVYRELNGPLPAARRTRR